jgi:hypothetical protein
MLLLTLWGYGIIRITDTFEMKKRKLRLTKARIEEMCKEGNYLKWVRLRKRYSEKALIKAGLLKVALPKA